MPMKSWSRHVSGSNSGGLFEAAWWFVVAHNCPSLGACHGRVWVGFPEVSAHGVVRICVQWLCPLIRVRLAKVQQVLALAGATALLMQKVE